MREWYIDIGTSYRAKNSNYWRDIVYDIISQDSSPGRSYVISDWFYPNEYKKDVATIRVHDVSVSIPPQTDTTEHLLDLFETDFLFFKGDEEKVRAQFPQYVNHIRL